VVAGVGRVDGDQRQVAQVGAAGQGRRLGGFGLGLGGGGEAGGMPWAWMAISEAARGSSSRPTTSSTLPRLGHSDPLGAADLGQHQVAVRRSRASARGSGSGCRASAWSTGSTRTSRRPCAPRPGCGGALAQPLDQPRLDLAASSRSNRTSSRSPRPGAPAAAAVRSRGQPHQRRSARRPWPAARTGRRRASRSTTSATPTGGRCVSVDETAVVGVIAAAQHPGCGSGETLLGMRMRFLVGGEPHEAFLSAARAVAGVLAASGHIPPLRLEGDARKAVEAGTAQLRVVH
jgi:hypothetical protein